MDSLAFFSRQIKHSLIFPLAVQTTGVGGNRLFISLILFELAFSVTVNQDV